MIVKERDVPRMLLKMEALNRRLPSHHKMKAIVDMETGNLRAGYQGEKSLDFILQFLHEDYHIFHDLRLPDAHGYFQIDTLILSPYFSVIIDVKNFSGTIIFDELNQCYREKDGSMEPFLHPVEQIRLQQYRLQAWMKQYSIPAHPIIPLIVFSNSNAYIQNLSQNVDIPNMLIKKEYLKTKLDQLKDTYRTQFLSAPHIHALTQHFIKKHTPQDRDVLEKYGITPNEIIKGVFCPACHAVPMMRKWGHWFCPSCACRSKDAHQSALSDYRLLINRLINNRKAREFLKLESDHVVYYLLSQLNVERIGLKSGRSYVLCDELFSEKQSG